MNGFAHQPPTPPQGDGQMKKAPDAWTEVEWGRAEAVFQRSKVYDPEIIPDIWNRFLKSARDNGRKDVLRKSHFSEGEQAALLELIRREEEEEASYEIIPSTPTEKYYEELTGSTLEHGLHPEDEAEIRKAIIDSM